MALSLVTPLAVGFSAPAAVTFTSNQATWNALWVDSTDSYWYDPMGAPVNSGYSGIINHAVTGGVPPGLSSSSSITAMYFSDDPLKAAMALDLVFPFGTFAVIDVIEFDSSYKIKNARTWAPAAMVGYNATLEAAGAQPWYDLTVQSANAYISAVVGFHLTAEGPGIWNNLWSPYPTTFWYDPVGSPVLMGYDAVIQGALDGHVPPGAMSTSSVTNIYYSADYASAVWALDLCFSSLGGACAPVIDVVTYDANWKVSSAETYIPDMLIPGFNASAPPTFYTDISGAFSAYLDGIINYHL